MKIRNLKIILYLFLTWLTVSCGEKSREKTSEDLQQQEEINYTGETLAKAYCGSCHVFPAPELLDKNTWIYGTFPQMGYRMGIYGETDRNSLIENGPGGKLVEERNIYPHQPILPENEWKLIQDYYSDNAPDSLIVPVKKLNMGIRNLKINIPEFHIPPPLVTAIKYNEEQNQVYVADTKADYSTINILDRNFGSIGTLAVPSPISHIGFRSDTILATLMGGFMPTDNPGGSVIKIFKGGGGNEYNGFISVLKNLQRPVHSTYMDVNGDSLEDIIVCEYGHHTGKLSLYIHQQNGQFEQKILSYDPGASGTVVKDLNNDGLVDIVALMAQGKERIDVYYNQGNGNFRVENLLQFPPIYGSVSFSMLDWNNDGFEDIIYMNGDNADYSMTFKPYHGLRIFLNDGENNFSEEFFQQLNGAYKAIPYDFDRDGDLDIATISFFPDFANTPEEGFVYMENISEGDSTQFDLYSFDQVSAGRWLIMETADINQDNFPELVLGSFTGMGINGDDDGKLGEKLIASSPTLMVLSFSQTIQ